MLYPSLISLKTKSKKIEWVETIINSVIGKKNLAGVIIILIKEIVIIIRIRIMIIETHGIQTIIKTHGITITTTTTTTTTTMEDGIHGGDIFVILI